MNEEGFGFHRPFALAILVAGIAVAASPQDSANIRALELEKPVEARIPAYQHHVYSLKLSAGQLLTFSVVPQKTDLFVDVLEPDGSKVLSEWRPSGERPRFAPFNVLAKASGIYRIQIRNEANAAGTYRIRIDELLTARAASERIAAQTARAEAAAGWVAANAIPLDTVEPGSGFRDLQPLKDLIGDSRIVALGESTHGTHEFFRLKHRIFEFLVSEMGFTVLGMETTMPEAFDLNRYVLSGEGDPVKALSNTHYWKYDTEEVLGLVQWMRQYNANPAHSRKLKFYGFDMQFAARAARVTVSYLRRVDPKEAAILQRTLDLLSNPLAIEDFALSKTRIRQFAATAAAIVSDFDKRKQQYVQRSSTPEWSVARQHAQILAQCMESLRPGADGALRDRYMAENIEWILREEGGDAKIALWAHNFHIAVQPRRMGDYLRKKFGNAMAVFGMTFNQGGFWAITETYKLRNFDVGPARDGTLEATLAAARPPIAVIPFRKLPNAGPAAEWLSSALRAREIGGYEEATEEVYHLPRVRAAQAYDAMLFVHRTSAAQALAGGLRAAMIKLPAPTNLGFETGEPEQEPPDWIAGAPRFWATAEQKELGFHVAISEEQPHIGRKSAVISRTLETLYGEDAGGLEQMVDAHTYRGKRIRLRAAVRTEVAETGNQAHLWLRVNGKDGDSSFFDAKLDHPITAREWRYYEILGEVDQHAETIEYGLALVGSGRAFLDDVSLRVRAQLGRKP